MKLKTIQVVSIVAIIGLALLSGIFIYQYQNLKVAHEKLLLDFSSLQISYSSLQGNYTSLSQNYTILSISYSDLQQSYSSLNESYNRALADLSEARRRVSNLESQVSVLQVQLATITAQYNALQTSYSDLQRDYTTLNEKYKEAQVKISSLQSQISTLQTQYDALLIQYQTLQNQYNTLVAKLNYKDFDNLVELSNWLKADPVSENEYSSTYDCDDFAFDLMANAFRSGYRMSTADVYLANSLYYIDASRGRYYLVPLTFSAWTTGRDYFRFGNHFADLAYVKTVGWVLIEPQTDEWWVLGTYEL